MESYRRSINKLDHHERRSAGRETNEQSLSWNEWSDNEDFGKAILYMRRGHSYGGRRLSLGLDDARSIVRSEIGPPGRRLGAAEKRQEEDDDLHAPSVGIFAESYPGHGRPMRSSRQIYTFIHSKVFDWATGHDLPQGQSLISLPAAAQPMARGAMLQRGQREMKTAGNSVPNYFTRCHGCRGESPLRWAFYCHCL